MAFASGNSITLFVQSLGVSNDQMLTSDIQSAHVDFGLAVKQGDANFGTPGVQYNIIEKCTVQPDPANLTTQPPTPAETIPAGDTVYCKLTNADAQVVAEGSATAPTDISADCSGSHPNGCQATLDIPITILAGTGFSSLDGHLYPNNDVQIVKDVKIVVKGASQITTPQGP